MPRDGSGVYSRVAGTPYVVDTVVDQAVVNSEMDDIATAISASIAKDGQTTATANLPMGANRHTGVGAAVALTDYARADQVQNGSFIYLSSVAGTNTITATASPTPSAYAAGQFFFLTPAATNTGATTLNISSLGAKNVYLNGAACVGGEIRQNVPIALIYDGTQFNIVGPYVGGNLPAGQIKFPAAQSASADANTLDDYEEGTFTPAITFTTPGNLSVSYSVQVGMYTKIGRLVHCQISITTSAFSHSTASGALTLTGLPFAANVTPNNFASGPIAAFQGVTKASYTHFGVRISAGESTLSMLGSGSGVGSSAVAAADMPTGGTVAIQCSITYPV